jgi:Uncharacterized protein conserved in bacteria (DUF2251)
MRETAAFENDSMLERVFKLGDAVNFASDSPSHPHSAFFEDDRETGYFFAMDLTRSENMILDAVHIYNVANHRRIILAERYGNSKNNPTDVRRLRGHSLSGLQDSQHISGFHREPPNRFSRCILECSCDRRRSQRICCF